MAKRKSARRGKSSGPRAWLLPMLVVALIGLIAALSVFFSSQEKPSVMSGDESVMSGDEIALRLRGIARESGCTRVQADEPITRESGMFIRHWILELRSPAAVKELCSDLSREAASWGRAPIQKSENGPECRLRVDLAREAFVIELRAGLKVAAAPGKVPPKERIAPTPTARVHPVLPASARGSLAILLDDAGQQMQLVPAAAALPPEIAVAILPFLPESSATAVALHRAGHEIWLHLPMEAEAYPEENPGPGAILSSMSEVDVRRRVHSALNNIPFVVGVNNHMGSRATADLRLMTWVMQEIGARHLFFIDSRTTAATVAETAARAQGVPCNRRRVFLDNDHSRLAISAQLEDAVYEARKHGEAIAIGHFKKTTIAVLAEEAPGLGTEGITLVAPGKLMH